MFFVINRTDLAVECYEENEKTTLSGVKITEKDNVTTVEVINENGAKSLGKPVGKYVVLDVNSFVNDTDILDGRLNEFSDVLKSVMPQSASSVLVVGLGNKKSLPILSVRQLLRLFLPPVILPIILKAI